MPSDGPEHAGRSKGIGSRPVAHLDEDPDAGRMGAGVLAVGGLLALGIVMLIAAPVAAPVAGGFAAGAAVGVIAVLQRRSAGAVPGQVLLISLVGIGLGIPAVVAAFVSPLPAVAALVTFVLWGAFDMFAANGWSKRLVTTVITLIWAVDLSIDLGLLLAVAGFAVWVEGAFVVADLTFLVGTLPAVVTAWSGQGGAEVFGEWVQRWLAFPAVTAATGLHTVELVTAASWAATPMAVAAVALAVLTVIKHVQARRNGAGERVERSVLRVEGVALIGYGLLRAAVEDQWVLAGVTAGVAIGFAVPLWIRHRRGAGDDVVDVDDHRPLVDGAMDERRPGPAGWAQKLSREVRSAVRWAVDLLRCRGPPRSGSTTGGAAS
jgi:hypothetical protein